MSTRNKRRIHVSLAVILSLTFVPALTLARPRALAAAGLGAVPVGALEALAAPLPMDPAPSWQDLLKPWKPPRFTTIQ